MFLVLMPSLGYGWGYRGWGPPYPRYVQRRRAQRAAVGGGSASFDHQAWGWGGDLDDATARALGPNVEDAGLSGLLLTEREPR